MTYLLLGFDAFVHVVRPDGMPTERVSSLVVVVNDGVCSEYLGSGSYAGDQGGRTRRLESFAAYPRHSHLETMVQSAMKDK